MQNGRTAVDISEEQPHMPVDLAYLRLNTDSPPDTGLMLQFSTHARWVILLMAAMHQSIPAVAQPTTSSPNILILFSDDQRADAIGAHGNPYIRTPNLDALAERGFSFRQAYVMGSHHGAVCAPSRAMLMTGRNLFRVYDNLDTLDTMPQRLQDVGYRTFGTGTWHQSRESFSKSFHLGKNIYFGGMGDHYGTNMSDLREDGTFSDPEPKGFSTTRFADAAVDFLKAYGSDPGQEPFFAYVSFTAPHDPRSPPQEYVDLYGGNGVPLPPNFMSVHPFDLGRMSMAVRDEHLAPWPRPPEMIREQIAEYYGL
ncbi:MAG: sulfatase-like hydrolase/transferase, partial [Rhodothermales bacterium]|nr:sulfatase-like hydrolase/transferase [Rhodothermales bacterium]